MICDACQQEIAVGDWPWCPHGTPTVVIVDDSVDGHWVDTLGHEDVWIESKSQLAREAEQRGLVNVVRHDDAYYRTQRKQHDERLADLKES